jgi:hypothetical protein
MRMAERLEIEWRDRSSRLMENQGQLAVDDWSLGGAVLALTHAFLRKKKSEDLGRWKTVVGRAGLGSSVGMVVISTYYLVKRRT